MSAVSLRTKSEWVRHHFRRTLGERKGYGGEDTAPEHKAMGGRAIRQADQIYTQPLELGPARFDVFARLRTYTPVLQHAKPWLDQLA
jgi:hypothetical protein